MNKKANSGYVIGVIVLLLIVFLLFVVIIPLARNVLS
jgi:hypothetical protein